MADLLTKSNPKTDKNTAQGALTRILYLAPSDLSGYDVCPWASPGCRAACLNTAGRGAMSSVQEARIRRTRWFFTDRESFLDKLVKEVKSLKKKAHREGLTPAVRLNGTSDIPWEGITVRYNGEKYRNIMELFPDVTFYDYTKSEQRALRAINGRMPRNYTLALSQTEDNHDSVRTIAIRAKKQYSTLTWMDIAPWKIPKTHLSVVFRSEEDMPDWYMGLPVVDGDAHDYMPLYNEPVVLGLRAKGRAKRDVSGFVVDAQ